MKVAVGTKNKAKVQALKESLASADGFKSCEVLSVSVSSGVADQPLSMEETIRGAKNRAQGAFDACEGAAFGFGIESGLVEAPGTDSGYLHISVCCIYDGKRFATGSSTGFEIPASAMKKIIDEKLDLTEACLETGISSNANLGQEEGLIGILTGGKVNRMEYSKESIRVALLQLVNASWYTKKSDKSFSSSP